MIRPETSPLGLTFTDVRATGVIAVRR
jgi:hypothetical protein